MLHRLAELMSQFRRLEADIVAHIAEVEERRLFAREAFPSMFAYSTDVLHHSEAEAYLRILAARASRKHPMLLTMLADGRLHLTAIMDKQGRRCPAQTRLQFHHRHPFGLGGAHSVENIRLMCRAHNDYLAACDYGREAMARHRAPRSRASPTAPG